jgi:hypothetical protein
MALKDAYIELAQIIARIPGKKNIAPRSEISIQYYVFASMLLRT